MTETAPPFSPNPNPEDLRAFWNVARTRANLDELEFYIGTNPTAALPPPSWCLGATAEEADATCHGILDGTIVGTSTRRADVGEQLPEPGDLGILLDGTGTARALLRTDTVTEVPLADVTAEQAAEEGATSLQAWRDASTGDDPNPVMVLERYTVLHRRED